MLDELKVILVDLARQLFVKQPQQPLVHLPSYLFVSLLPQELIDAVVVAEVGSLALSDLGIGLRADAQFSAHFGIGHMCQRREVTEQCAHLHKK